MREINIFQLLPDGDKDIIAMQQPETLISLLVPSKSDSPDSSLSPRHQENQSKRDANHHQQDQEQEQAQEQEQDEDQEQEQAQEQKQKQAQEKKQEQDQEKLQDESRSKRKWGYNDETSRVEILGTPRTSYIRCYCPPPAPRKPKAAPAMKGRAMWLKRSVVFLDLAREVESMFPPSVLQDFGKKIKKARS